MLEQELQNHRYLNVAPVTRESDSVDVCFAVPRPAEPELLTILNKAIGNIRTADREAIVNRNLTTVGYTGVSLKELIYSNPLLCILGLSGVLALIMLVIFLITRSRMMNAVMKSRVEAAEAKSMAKSVFLSKMSHEIRTPMNAIVGLTDLTRMEKNVPPEVERKLEKIQSSSQYLLSLINDILDMSRIENDKMELEEKGFSLSVMLKELQEMLSGQTEENGLRFVNENYIEHDWVTGDSVRLRQVLTNLLSNAVKFTPQGGEVRLKAEEISCGKERAQYRFSVKDTGMGISLQDQERIFTSFEQIEPGASRSAGVGLGLAISRNIVRLMGGDIEVKSEPGKGTEFFMTLSFPLYSQVSVCENKAAEDEYSLCGVKILLAEDNDLNSEIAQELLSTQGIESSRASNGQEAVELFLSAAPGEFHAILMDIQMPVKNGYEAAREIRASGRVDAGIPIIAMTANTFREDKAEAREAGMDGFVPKPVNPEVLFSELRNILQKTGLQN